jgi:hypothetical protein
MTTSQTIERSQMLVEMILSCLVTISRLSRTSCTQEPVPQVLLDDDIGARYEISRRFPRANPYFYIRLVTMTSLSVANLAREKWRYTMTLTRASDNPILHSDGDDASGALHHRMIRV